MFTEIFNSLGEFFSPFNVSAMAVAAVCNASCALVGCFLVLRKMSLMGDALSHAILPGLVIALLVSHDGGAVAMLLGALAAGMVTTFLTQMAQRYGRVAADASLGVVFTSLFALGVVLVKLFTADIHFDISCIYEGALLSEAMDTVTVGPLEIPRPLFSSVPVLLIVIAAIVLLWKEWKLATFDAPLAETMGFAPTGLHYLLMLLVSLTVMTSFKSIGSILVIAMLIAPAASAQMLTDRLASMLSVAVAVAVAATLVGYVVSDRTNLNPAGCIAVAAGGFYVLAALLGPRHGVFSRMIHHVRLALRVRREDLLARMYRNQEGETPLPMPPATAEQIAGGGWLGRRAVSQLLRGRLLQRSEATSAATGYQLTEQGAAEGKRLVRSHRLWEAYLVNEVGLPSDHVHDPAHRVEHFLDESIDEEIIRTLDTIEDPHGREIPDKSPEKERPADESEERG